MYVEQKWYCICIRMQLRPALKLRVKDSLWWAQKPCDGLDSLWNQQLVIDSTASEGLGSLWGTRQLVRGSTACEGLDICDELYSLWGTCSLLFVRPHWELGQSRRFKDVTQCNMELMWGWGEGGWGRDMRCWGGGGVEVGIGGVEGRMEGRVEWFSFFAIFEDGHIAADWPHLYEFHSKKSANFDYIYFF